MMNEERSEMLSQSNEVCTQATERLFLAVVNQAILDVLENGQEAKEAERWLHSKDFDALDRLFACPGKPVESRKSRPAECHREPLAEPDMNLSAHPAPIN